MGAEPPGRDIIHSVTNPIARLTGAIHVYGGDFFGVPRSEWDPESLLEQRCDRIVRSLRNQTRFMARPADHHPQSSPLWSIWRLLESRRTRK